ncbi:MAG: hypothetical protein ACE5K2_07060 [Candidatus Zixiibacteriota bacterium]
MEKLKKTHIQIFFMGAYEAREILEFLHHAKTLTRRTVSQYVIPALTSGPEMVEGSEAYESLLRSALGERYRLNYTSRGRTNISGEKPLKNESYAYLSEMLTAASDKRSSWPHLDLDDAPAAVDQEVRELLGKPGLAYLGIPRGTDTLRPNYHRVMANLEDDWKARKQLRSRRQDSDLLAPPWETNVELPDVMPDIGPMFTQPPTTPPDPTPDPGPDVQIRATPVLEFDFHTGYRVRYR